MKNIGFIGVGCISGIYLENITHMFREINVIGVCDLIRRRAEDAKEKYPHIKVYADMYELLADPEVDIVLNITRPYEHYAVTKAALLAGKHVYSEKPLSPDLAEARELVALAEEKGLYLGGAPDTFLGAGIQTCRRLIDDGMIGTPTAASAHMLSHGPENWHPDPEFFYQYGGGPMMDMGPYYMTALVNLLGRAEEVMGFTKKTFEVRPILNQAKMGIPMPVEVPTHEAGVIRFASGVIASFTASFDVYADRADEIVIYGTEGTLRVPDPNTFGGDVLLMRAGQDHYEKIPLLYNYPTNSRALGLADMAKAIEEGRAWRANSMQQLHVVELMSAFRRSSAEGRAVRLESPYERSAPMVYSPVTGILD